MSFYAPQKENTGLYLVLKILGVMLGFLLTFSLVHMLIVTVGMTTIPSNSDSAYLF